MTGKNVTINNLEWREPSLRSGFEQFSETLNGQKSGELGESLHSLRQKALEALVRRGLPSSKDEDWRYTNVSHLGKAAYQLSGEAVSSAITTESLTKELTKYNLAESEARLVFVDGRFSSELSQLPLKATAGVTIQTLEQFLQGDADKSPLEKELLAKIGVLADPGRQSFDALNTAFLRDGLVVHIARGVKLEAPIQQIFFNTEAPGISRVDLGRTLIVLDDSAEATLFEIHVRTQATSSSTATSHNLLKAMTSEFFVGNNSRLEHIKVISESDSTDHFSTLHLTQARDSLFRTTSFFLNARLVRSEILPALNGNNGNCEMHGLTLAGGEQLVDNFTAVNHVEPHCESTQLFKGIYAGKSRGVFSGTITVQQTAQKTNAFQKNASVLLSDDASVDTKPQLKIWADDVKCTHGATVGQLDEAALFYLRSRGISKIAAQKMLVRAFADDVTAKIQNTEIHDIVGLLVGERLDELHI